MNKLPEKTQTVYAGLDLAKATLSGFGQALAPAPTPVPDTTRVKRRKLVRWQAQVEKLVRLDGVGLITALVTLCERPELGRLNRRPAAALAGLAPWTRQSGPWEGQRHIGGGRSQVRQGLDLAAVAVARMKPTALGQFYQRLRRAGQPAQVALTAVMRKLLLQMNRVLKPT